MVDDLTAIHLDRYKSSGVELVMGEGKFTAPKTMRVTLQDGSEISYWCASDHQHRQSRHDPANSWPCGSKTIDAFASIVPGVPLYEHNPSPGVTQPGTVQLLNPNAFVSTVDPSNGGCLVVTAPGIVSLGRSAATRCAVQTLSGVTST